MGFGTAIMVTAAYLALQFVSAMSYGALASPIVMGPVIGLLMGDLQTGIILGGTIHAMYLGVMNVGGTLPADSGVATVVTTAFVIATGSDIATGLALAYPLGTIAGQLYTITTPLFSMFDGFYDRLIYGHKGDLRIFGAIQPHGLWVYGLLAQAICIFGFIAVGSEALSAVLNMIPANVMAGMNAAGNMMVAVGLGMTLQLIWNNAVGGFFFVGYFAASVLGMNSVQIAIIGVAFALFYFSLLNNKSSDVAVAEVKADDGGDFFG